MSDAIGKTRKQIDVLDPARARALHATLDLAGAAPGAGDPLPPFWHYVYFWEAAPPAALGRDGHPATGGFIPDTGLPRRMWAGGALEFLAPVLLGQPAERETTISNVQRKQGRSGALAVVTLDHCVRQNGQVCVRERQDLIYREEPKPQAVATTLSTTPPKSDPKARTDETHTRRVAFNPTLLFRYSALTFNGHRIHYDRAYCQSVEGYPGLVTHGPLLAQLLIHFAQDLMGAVKQFSFRATAPAFDFEVLELCARESDTGLQLWVRGPDGRQCMTAEAN